MWIHQKLTQECLSGLVVQWLTNALKNQRKYCSLRYLAARIFMLSGTDRKNALFTCMTKAYCDELGSFKTSFYHQN